MIRVALADDQELVRAGFAALLDAEDDIEVTGEAADGQQAVRIAEQHRPDVMLMDIRMPVLDGIEATGDPRGRTRLGPCHHPDHVRARRVRLRRPAGRGRRVPGEGHRRRRTDPRGPGGGGRRSAAGPHGHQAAHRRVRLPHAGGAQRSRPGRADPRWHEVVALIAQGLSNQEISKKIYVSASTAKTHANRAMTKLGARDRAQLVVFADQAWLVRPGWAD